MPLLEKNGEKYWICGRCGNGFRPDDLAVSVSITEMLDDGSKTIVGLGEICTDCGRGLCDEADSYNADELKQIIEAK